MPNLSPSVERPFREKPGGAICIPDQQLMDDESKWAYILQLDDELLVGGVILSEWSAFLVRDADTAFCNGAYLAAILAAQAAIEAHLRYEYASGANSQRSSLYELIKAAPLPDELRQQLHTLRKYRNRWVHVSDPGNDADLLARPEYHEAELERVAYTSMRAMRQVIYLEQWL